LSATFPGNNEYFFIPFSYSSDLCHLDNVSVANKRLMATYAYKKAAMLEAVWPKMRNVTIPQARIDQFATGGTVKLGPIPVTDASVSSKPSKYLPWLFQVLPKTGATCFNPRAHTSRFRQ
jgi:hypothetical protein